jgi:hypothetical protein
MKGKAVPWLTRLVAGFPLRRPGFEARSSPLGFVVDKAILGLVSPGTLVSLQGIPLIVPRPSSFIIIIIIIIRA